MKPIHVLLATFISMMWGINFVVAKATLTFMPPFFLLACRLVLVVVILLPFLHKPELPLSSIFRISVVLTVMHFGLMYIALGFGLDSSVGVVIDQMRVPFAVIFGYFLLGESIGRRVAFGITVSLIGTFVITGVPNVSNNHFAMWMMIGASASWAFYNIQVKNLKDVRMLSFIGWVSLFGAPQLFLISFVFESGQIESLFAYPLMSAGSLLYMAIFVTIIGHGSWYYLLQKYPVNSVVPYSLLTPVFGMAAGLIFLNEELTSQLILGAILTVTGVAVIVISSKSSALKSVE